MIDVNSSGVNPAQKIDSFPGFAVPFAVPIMKTVGDKLAVSAVSIFDNVVLANDILKEDRLDCLLVGGDSGKNPNRVWNLAKKLQVGIAMPIRSGHE